jgi:hypothetical protein
VVETESDAPHLSNEPELPADMLQVERRNRRASEALIVERRPATAESKPPALTVVTRLDSLVGCEARRGGIMYTGTKKPAGSTGQLPLCPTHPPGKDGF